MFTFFYDHFFAPCTIESGTEDMLMEVCVVARTIRHQLEGCYVVLDDPQLQASCDDAVDTLDVGTDGQLVDITLYDDVDAHWSRFLQLFVDAGAPSSIFYG